MFLLFFLGLLFLSFCRSFLSATCVFVVTIIGVFLQGGGSLLCRLYCAPPLARTIGQTCASWFLSSIGFSGVGCVGRSSDLCSVSRETIFSRVMFASSKPIRRNVTHNALCNSGGHTEPCLQEGVLGWGRFGYLCHGRLSQGSTHTYSGTQPSLGQRPVESTNRVLANHASRSSETPYKDL